MQSGRFRLLFGIVWLALILDRIRRAAGRTGPRLLARFLDDGAVLGTAGLACNGYDGFTHAVTYRDE